MRGEPAAVYVDTSAVAKWYLNEPRSDVFTAWIVEQPEPWISTLTVLEMRCLLARRRRAGEITTTLEARAFSTFEEDVANAHLFLQPIDDRFLRVALALIERLPDLPLRTLDAIHLAVARHLATPRLATADERMAEAAAVLGLDVIRFHP